MRLPRRSTRRMTSRPSRTRSSSKRRLRAPNPTERRDDALPRAAATNTSQQRVPPERLSATSTFWAPNEYLEVIKRSATERLSKPVASGEARRRRTDGTHAATRKRTTARAQGPAVARPPELSLLRPRSSTVRALACLRPPATGCRATRGPPFPPRAMMKLHWLVKPPLHLHADTLTTLVGLLSEGRRLRDTARALWLAGGQRSLSSLPIDVPHRRCERSCPCPIPIALAGRDGHPAQPDIEGHWAVTGADRAVGAVTGAEADGAVRAERRPGACGTGLTRYPQLGPVQW